MSHTASTITDPVSVADVNYVLGAGSLDVGTLCSYYNAVSNTGINKWSRYKPVRHTKKETLTDDDFNSTNYGLNLGDSDRRTTNPLDETWRNIKVTYLLPQIGTNWMRLTDFNGYNHDAQPPISPAGDVVLSSLTTSADIYFANHGFAQASDLTIKDFPFLADYYPCVVISYTYNGSTYYQYATASTKFGSVTGTDCVTVKSSDLNANWKDLKYFMCGFSAQKTSFSATNVSGNFICLPSDKKLEGVISRVDASSLLQLTATGISAGDIPSSDKMFLTLSAYQFATTTGNGLKLPVGNSGTVSLKFTLQNKTSSAITVARTSLFFKPVNNLAGSTIDHVSVSPAAMATLSGSSYTTVSSVSVPANGSVTIALQFNYASVTNNSGTVVTVSDSAESYMQIIVYYGSTSTAASQIGSVAFNVKK